MKKLLALTMQPIRGAATRYRVEAHREALRERGIELHLASFLDDDASREFHRGVGGGLSKAKMLVRSAVRQAADLARIGKVDAVFVQREALVVGPPVLELAYGAGVPLVFDFDDAVWLPQVNPNHAVASYLLKAPWKTPLLVKRAAHVIVGAGKLADYVRGFHERVTVSPTVVSAEAWAPRPHRLLGALENEDVPVLGWVGTFSTAPLLELALPALRRLHAEGIPFRLRVVGAGEGFSLGGVPIETRRWALATEVDDVRDFDVGLAPMRSDAWSEGKCAFKQAQYMAAGVPFVSSHVGGAREIVRHDDNGLVASNDDEWYRAIKSLLEDKALRARLAKSARADVVRELSTEVQSKVVAGVVAGVLGL
jgi:glycosyltransferase involved in cell wall biosynthesis